MVNNDNDSEELRELTEPSESKEETNTNLSAETEEPITVYMMHHWTEETHEERFKQHVEEALPHINLEYSPSRGGREAIEETIVSGNIPDIVMTSDFEFFDRYDLLMDQVPLIEAHNFDLSRFDETFIETLREHSRPGELNALPLFRIGYSTAYNKDMFDAFGESYPEMGITWEETIELASQVTGDRDGVPHHGLWFDESQLVQVGALLLDAQTDEPNIMENAEFRQLLEWHEQVINIPGSFPEEEVVNPEQFAEHMWGVPGAAEALFDYAILPSQHWLSLIDIEAETGLRFDWVNYPLWGGEYGEYTPNELYHNLFVTATSEVPDTAFEVVDFLTDEEYQTFWASEGGISAIEHSSDQVREAFGSELENYEILQQKNVDSALFEYTQAPIPVASRFETDVREPVFTYARQRLLEGADIVTILREAEDLASGIVEELRQME